MRVFIVGAGFSKATGYPLGSETLTKIGVYVKNPYLDVLTVDLWREYMEWEDAQTAPGVSEIIDTGNVEFIITHLDLLGHAREFNRIQYFRRARHSIGPLGNEVSSERERHLEETETFFSKASVARDRLRWCLVKYFEHKDCEGREEENEEYIIDFCNKIVNQGDVFITFNYDALVERALYSLCRWSPSDGYGFEVDFKEIEQWKGHKPAHLGKSEVKVLKLHGSVGWYINESTNKLFLNWGRFLQSFIPGIRDASEPDYTPDQYEHPVVIEPSFIKPIEQKELLGVWDEARSKLEEAKEVFIIGYSMPQADASAQNLIVHSLRANSYYPKVTVVDPDKEILDRYEELLGFKVEKQRYKVEDWVSSLITN